MFLTNKSAVKSEKNVKNEQTKTARKSDKLREVQLALLERVSGGLCRLHMCQ